MNAMIKEIFTLSLSVERKELLDIKGFCLQSKKVVKYDFTSLETLKFQNTI